MCLYPSPLLALSSLKFLVLTPPSLNFHIFFSIVNKLVCWPISKAIIPKALVRLSKYKSTPCCVIFESLATVLGVIRSKAATSLPIFSAVSL